MDYAASDVFRVLLPRTIRFRLVRRAPASFIRGATIAADTKLRVEAQGGHRAAARLDERPIEKVTVIRDKYMRAQLLSNDKFEMKYATKLV